MSLLHAYAQRCFDRRAEHVLGTFAKRNVGALAVDLGRGRDEDQLLLLVRVFQHDLGAVHVGFNRVHRLLDDQLHADGCGEMKDDVAAVDHLGEQRFVGHRVDGVREARCLFEMADVVDGTGGQVVEHRHLVSVAQQSFGEVGSDEPGASGNQSFHAGRCPFAKAATVSATRTMSSSESRGDSGSDNSWPAAETATGHSCETNAANAGWFVSAAG